MNVFRFGNLLTNLLELWVLAFTVFSGTFLLESSKLASAVATTNPISTTSTVEHETVSVKVPETAVENSTAQELPTTENGSVSIDQCSTAGNSSEPDSFEFYSEIKPQTELKVGMKVNVTIVAVYPKGFYNKTGIEIYDDTPRNNFDVINVRCIYGRGIQESTYYHASNNLKSESIFSRSSFVSEVHRGLNVSGVGIEDRTVKCIFLVYLHNADGLIDRQKINLIATLDVLASKENLTIEKPVTFIARTFLLNPNNKSAKYEMDSFLPVFAARRNDLKKVTFRCWIPYYNPHIKIIMRSHQFTMYLKLISFGDNFTPGAEKMRLPKVARFAQIDPDYLEIIFPAHWVNRGYSYTEETSDADLLEFQAGVIMSASVITGVNYTIGIEVLLHNNQVWNSSAEIIAYNFSVSENSDYTYNINAQTVELNENEIFPNTKSKLFLKISLLKQGENIVNITITSKTQTDFVKPSLTIEKLFIHNVSSDVFCKPLNVSFYNKGLSFQSEAFWTLYFLNINESNIGTVYLLLEYKLDSTTVTIGERYSFTVLYGDRLLEYQVPINNPAIYQGEKWGSLSKIHKIFDGNHTTCVELPQQGEKPPWFWMRLNTTWLNISFASYNVTVVGIQIPCQPNGRTLLQVSYLLEYPRLENELHNSMTFCSFISSTTTSDGRLVECGFQCQCSESKHCQEMIIFMANQDPLASWRLCEISATNL